MTTDFDDEETMAVIGHWLDSMVIGLNLCPFAGSVRRRGLLRIVLASSDRTEQCLQELADEAHRLTVADEDATTLFVLPQGFADFDDYLDLLAVGEALLAELGYTGILQLASFHPRYQFDGTGIDELSNWTNRAPLPILHLLREDSVARAVEGHPDPQGIPGRNIQRLEELGLSGVKRLLCSKH